MSIEHPAQNLVGKERKPDEEEESPWIQIRGVMS